MRWRKIGKEEQGRGRWVRDGEKQIKEVKIREESKGKNEIWEKSDNFCQIKTLQKSIHINFFNIYVLVWYLIKIDIKLLYVSQIE